MVVGALRMRRQSPMKIQWTISPNERRTECHCAGPGDLWVSDFATHHAVCDWQGVHIIDFLSDPASGKWAMPSAPVFRWMNLQ